MYRLPICTTVFALALFPVVSFAAVPHQYLEKVMNTTLLQLVRENAVNISTHRYVSPAWAD
jgi:hypothetical protein